MKTVLILEPNSLVAEDIAEIILGRWHGSCPVVVSSADHAIAAIRGGALFQAAVLRFSHLDPDAEKLLALLTVARTALVMVDDAGAPALSDKAKVKLLPNAIYIAQPFTTGEMLATLERALTHVPDPHRSA